jgi:hypothetical protein
VTRAYLQPTAFVIIGFLLLFTSSNAQAEPPPQDRLWYSNATYGRVNPLGFVDSFKLGWRRRLSTSDHLLLDNTYSFTAVNVMATPAFTRVGVYAEVLPITMVRLFAGVDGIGFYGTFDQVLGMEGTGRYSDAAIEAQSALSGATGGWVLTFGGTVRAKAGPVAIRSTPTFTRFDIAVPDDKPFFYDQIWDRLAPNRGLMVNVDSDVLVVAGKVRAGVRHTFSDDLGGNPSDSDGAMANHRVGPLFAYQFHAKGPGTKFDEPTLFVLTQWWMAHPYRTGEEQPQGLPLIALGFAFNGDLAMTTSPAP